MTLQIDDPEESVASRDSLGKLARRGRVRLSMRRLAPVIEHRPWTVAAVGISAFAAGLCEAAVLALVAAIAAAMSGVARLPTLTTGPIDLEGRIPTMLAVAACLSILRLGLQIVIVRLPARLSGRVQTELRDQLFSAYLAASWATKCEEQEGHLQELMGGQTTQAGVGVIYLGNGFSAGLMSLTLVASAFILSPVVAAAVSATSLVLFAALRPLSRRVRRHSAATSASSVAQASGVAETVRLAEEVQVFGAVAAIRSRMRGRVRDYEMHHVRTRTMSGLVPVLYQSGVIFLLVAGLAVVYAADTARMAVLGAVVLFLVRASSYGQQLQTAYQSLGEALPYLDRLTQAIAWYRQNEHASGHLSIGRVESLDFKSVSFQYRPGVPVLRELTFSVASGEAIGIVGPSGAGKSTLVQLLLRLREPTRGSYHLNGVEAREFAEGDWQRAIAYLPQEPHVMSGTVADNIRFHRDWIDDAAVRKAARLARIEAEIDSWVDDFDTIIGHRADAISGGQRQRLCLARALAGPPELLILDEPTSALDPRSESLIQESLRSLRGSVTLVIVAHRLTTLDLCDRVMVIRDGVLEAFATAGRLYDSNDFYRQAVDLALTGRPL